MTSHRLVPLAVASALVLAACTSTPPTATTSSSPTPTAAVPSPTSAAHRALPVTSLVSFAGFAGVPMLDPDTPAYPGPAHPTTLTSITVAPSLRDTVNALQVPLAANGAVVQTAGFPQAQSVYEGNWYAAQPSYVTTDVAYHEWHLAFDKVLRDLEQTRLLPDLTTLLTALVQASAAQASQLAGTAQADAASRAAQLYQVAATEAGLKVTTGPLAAQEIALIKAHEQVATSPLLGTKVDYSAFTPRGHYTRNADLTRYFLAMSVLGQLAFCLPGTDGCADAVATTRIGLLATRPLVVDPKLTSLWSQIYEPTAFLVGLSDDYTPTELAKAATSAAPRWLSDPTALADDHVITATAKALTSTRAVQINPNHASVRVMGARFVLDSYVLDQLIYPNVGTADNPRILPSGLDTAAVLGSALAAHLLDTTGAPGFENYSTQRTALSKAVAARPTPQWGATVYDSWLYALQPVLVQHGAAYPDYMRTPVWAAKDLQTAMSSYTELKHDTILYSKQAMAEAGGADPTTLTNWVEPEPVAFERVVAAADLMRRGLDQRGLLTDSSRTLLSTLTDFVTFLAGVARTELAGGKVSAADNDKLRDVGATLEQLGLYAGDLAADGTPAPDPGSALVADVANGDGHYLELGTAGFDELLVVVPKASGGFEVAVGAVNSYREFTSTEPLTDEQWRTAIDQKTAAARPTWLDALYGG